MAGVVGMSCRMQMRAILFEFVGSVPKTFLWLTEDMPPSSPLTLPLISALPLSLFSSLPSPLPPSPYRPVPLPPPHPPHPPLSLRRPYALAGLIEIVRTAPAALLSEDEKMAVRDFVSGKKDNPWLDKPAVRKPEALRA